MENSWSLPEKKNEWGKKRNAEQQQTTGATLKQDNYRVMKKF